MDDISPELLNKIQKYFAEDVAAIQEEIKSGRMSYEEAYGASIRVGTALSKAFNENISAEILPDGRMYYNIANKVVLPMLKEEHDIVSQAAVQAQQNANKAAGIGIRAQAAEFDTDRAKGIIDRVSSEPYDDIKWILNEPVKTFAKNVVDRTLQKNVEFQGKSGLHPKIVRRASAGACEWCLAVAGTYSYPDVPHDVFRRHENCDCVTEYIDGGKYQDVWTKKTQTYEERLASIQERITLAEKQKNVRKKQVQNVEKSDKINSQRNQLRLDPQFFAKKTKHAAQRAIERGITDADIDDALENPLNGEGGELVIDEFGEESIKYIGRKATVCISTDESDDIEYTVWKTSKSTRRRYGKE